MKKWVYERAVRHNGLNFHLWSTQEDGNTRYAVTRTSAVAPQGGRLYGSLQDLAAKTGVPVVPLDTVAAEEFAATAHPRISIGLYRRDASWVQVDYGNRQGPLPRDLYEANGYEPGFDQLLTEAKYRAFQDVAAKRKSAASAGSAGRR